MPGEISFNPIIFISAGLFSLITVMISCTKPAKIAGNISPIEALRYSGDISKKQNKSRNTTKGGKLYKMAWYNVFREKKRAIVVFLSLFMGIITFLSVDTFLDSISVENYIDKYIKNDFVIQNIEGAGNKLDNDTINKIEDMEGVETVNLIKISELELEMNKDILLPALKYNYEKFNRSQDELESDLEKFNENPSLLKASVVGIDDSFIEGFNNALNNKINIDAFKNGQIALVSSWYYGDDYKNINGDLAIKNPKTNNLKKFSIKILEEGSTLLPSGMYAPLGIPTIYASNTVLENLDNNATNYLLYVNVNKKYEEQIETELKTIGTINGLFIESKSDKTEEFNKSQMIMSILGGGISIILILIGILNFINIMITSINTRLKEFAIMESIGMTKKQIKKMVTFEGLYYALVTTTIVFTLGVGIIYGVSELTKNIVDYAVFVFPTTSLIVLTIMIFIVCLITPSIVFKVLSKKSVTERVRE